MFILNPRLTRYSDLPVILIYLLFWPTYSVPFFPLFLPPFWMTFLSQILPNYLFQFLYFTPMCFFRVSPFINTFFNFFTIFPKSSTLSSQIVQHEVHFTSTPSSTYTSTPSSTFFTPDF